MKVADTVGVMGRVSRLLLATGVLAAACAPSALGSPSISPSAGGELAKLRARGTLIVAIRVEAPPANRAMGDPAHAQKRAFESAVAMIIATRLLGPNAKVELRSTGGDRLSALEQGADVALTVDTAAARARAQLSVPYAAAALVLAAKSSGPVRDVPDINGRAVAVAMDELGARDIAVAYLQQRGITATLGTYMGVSGAATAVDNGQAVALVGDKIGVSVIATERSLAIVGVLMQLPYVLAVRKTAPDVAAAIDDALRAAIASGEIRDAAAKAAFPYEAP